MPSPHNAKGVKQHFYGYVVVLRKQQQPGATSSTTPTAVLRCKEAQRDCLFS